MKQKNKKKRINRLIGLSLPLSLFPTFFISSATTERNNNPLISVSDRISYSFKYYSERDLSPSRASDGNYFHTIGTWNLFDQAGTLIIPVSQNSTNTMFSEATADFRTNFSKNKYTKEEFFREFKIKINENSSGQFNINHNYPLQTGITLDIGGSTATGYYTPNSLSLSIENNYLIVNPSVINLKIIVTKKYQRSDRYTTGGWIYEFTISFLLDYQKQKRNDIENYFNTLTDQLNSNNLIRKESTSVGSIRYESNSAISNHFNRFKPTVSSNKIASNYDIIKEKQRNILNFLSNSNLKYNIRPRFEDNVENNYSSLFFTYNDYNNRLINKEIMRINYDQSLSDNVNKLIQNRVRIMPGAYISKNQTRYYSPVQNEEAEVIRQADTSGDIYVDSELKFYNFPELEFVALSENNEILYINGEPIPVFNNIFKYKFKDNKNTQSAQILLERVKALGQKYNETKDSRDQELYLQEKAKYDNLNTFNIEVKQFRDNDFKTIYKRKIIIQSQQEELFDVKYFAWNPETNLEHRDLVEKYLKDPNGKFILDQNEEKIENTKYNPLINRKTGTNREFVVGKYVRNNTKYEYMEPDFFNLLDPINANGEFDLTDFNTSHNSTTTYFMAEAHVVYGGVSFELSPSITDLVVFELKNTPNGASWYKDAETSSKLNYFKNKQNVFSKKGVFLFLTKNNKGIAKYKIFLIKENTANFSNISDEQFSKAKELPAKFTNFWDHYYGKHLATFLKLKYNFSLKEVKKLNHNDLINYWKEYFSDAFNRREVLSITPNVNQSKVNNFFANNTFHNNNEEIKQKQIEELKKYIITPYIKEIDTEIEITENSISYTFRSNTSLLSLNLDNLVYTGRFKEESPLFEPTYIGTNLVDFLARNKGKITKEQLNNRANNFFDTKTYENFDITFPVVNLNKENSPVFGTLSYRIQLKPNKSLPFNNKEYLLSFEFNENDTSNPYNVGGVDSVGDNISIDINGATDRERINDIIKSRLEEDNSSVNREEITVSEEEIEKAIEELKENDTTTILINNKNDEKSKEITITNSNKDIKEEEIQQKDLSKIRISNLNLVKITSFENLKTNIFNHLEKFIIVGSNDLKRIISIENETEKLNNLLTPNRKNFQNLKIIPLNNSVFNFTNFIVYNDLNDVLEVEDYRPDISKAINQNNNSNNKENNSKNNNNDNDSSTNNENKEDKPFSEFINEKETLLWFIPLSTGGTIFIGITIAIVFTRKRKIT